MSAAEQLRQVLLGMQADQRSYAMLQDLLEQQFQAVAQQRSDDLLHVAERIIALVDELDEQRRLRRGLVAGFLGRQENLSMEALLELLPANSRRVMSESWQGLVLSVHACKTLNARNCELLVEQHDLMQSLLGKEQDTYAEL